jgi:four helix bundle protein
MKILKHEDLEVYQSAYKAAMQIFNLTIQFPKHETYSLTDQIRRSSRSVCANIAEAYYRRKYPKNFIAHIGDSLAEAAETRVWLDFCCDCKYIDTQIRDQLKQDYSNIIGKLIVMMNQSDLWRL